MGAPNTVYLFSGNATFPIHLEGEIKLDSYPALPLAIYGDQIKQLFYLDAMLMLDDEQGNTAFIGMIKDIPGSLNYRMHSAGRFFKLRLAPGDTNQDYIVLNDAGLNTLAFSEDIKLESGPTAEVGNILIHSFTVKSAVYVYTDKIEIEYSKGSDFSVIAGTFLTHRGVDQNTVYTNPDITVTNENFEIGEAYWFRISVDNVEGSYKSGAVVKTILAVTIQLSYSPIDVFFNTPPQPFYIKFRRPITIGDTLFSNKIATAPAAQGYYGDGTYYYYQDYSNETGRWQIIRMGLIAGAVDDYLFIQIDSYSDESVAKSCRFQQTLPATLFVRKFDNQSFRNSDLTMMSLPGWYTRINSFTGLAEWTYIDSESRYNNVWTNC